MYKSIVFKVLFSRLSLHCLLSSCLLLTVLVTVTHASTGLPWHVATCNRTVAQSTHYLASLSLRHSHSTTRAVTHTNVTS